jgi:hypothetical protein
MNGILKWLTRIFPCGATETETQADSRNPSPNRYTRQLDTFWAQLAWAKPANTAPNSREDPFGNIRLLGDALIAFALSLEESISANKSAGVLPNAQFKIL